MWSRKTSTSCAILFIEVEDCQWNVKELQKKLETHSNSALVQTCLWIVVVLICNSKVGDHWQFGNKQLVTSWVWVANWTCMMTEGTDAEKQNNFLHFICNDDDGWWPFLLVDVLKEREFDFLTPPSPALLDALTKNGSSTGNGAYRRRPAESSEGSGARPERESQESGGGDVSKGFTKDQLEGVQRWEC